MYEIYIKKYYLVFVLPYYYYNYFIFILFDSAVFQWMKMIFNSASLDNCNNTASSTHPRVISNLHYLLFSYFFDHMEVSGVKFF